MGLRSGPSLDLLLGRHRTGENLYMKQDRRWELQIQWSKFFDWLHLEEFPHQNAMESNSWRRDRLACFLNGTSEGEGRGGFQAVELASNPDNHNRRWWLGDETVWDGDHVPQVHSVPASHRSVSGSVRKRQSSGTTRKPNRSHREAPRKATRSQTFQHMLPFWNDLPCVMPMPMPCVPNMFPLPSGATLPRPASTCLPPLSDLPASLPAHLARCSIVCESRLTICRLRQSFAVVNFGTVLRIVPTRAKATNSELLRHSGNIEPPLCASLNNNSPSWIRVREREREREKGC